MLAHFLINAPFPRIETDASELSVSSQYLAGKIIATILAKTLVIVHAQESIKFISINCTVFFFSCYCSRYKYYFVSLPSTISRDVC